MSVLDGISAFARLVLPQSVVLWLRGDFTSVRGRFIGDKIERLRLLVHRMAGGNYLTWYARRLDGFTANPDYIDEAFHETGFHDLETMKRLGLKPHHTLHEFGCGSLRSARHFAEFLDPGNLSVNDASGGRIAAGRHYLLEKGFDFDSYRVAITVNSDNSLDWVRRKVDFVWCHAVFVHMPENDIEEVLRNLKKIMHGNSEFIFTYSEKPGETRPSCRMGVKDWWHTHAFFGRLARRNGLEIEDLSPLVANRDGYNPKNRMARLTLPG